MDNTATALATQSARKFFGGDIEIMVARCPAFGYDDINLVVRGKRHAEVARDLCRFLKSAKVETLTIGEFMGVPASTYSSVTARASTGAAA